MDPDTGGRGDQEGKAKIRSQLWTLDLTLGQLFLDPYRVRKFWVTSGYSNHDHICTPGLWWPKEAVFIRVGREFL